MTDEMELDKLGEEKIAVFAVIPDTHTSYNFLVSVLYTQIFQNAFYRADNKFKGALPIPIHFLMDEFANVALPDDFDKILSVMRSRNVFVSIILQNISQLKALFEKQWESIVRQLRPIFISSDGNEQSTHKMVSELLGKESIDLNTYGKSTGHSGSYSTNYQATGRELLMADEVRMLENEKSILLIRGEKPVIDFKYDILKHPNIKYTTDGNGKMYEHGIVNKATGTISQLTLEDLNNVDYTKESEEIENTTYELLSEEEIKNYIYMEEYENEKNKKINE